MCPANTALFLSRPLPSSPGEAGAENGSFVPVPGAQLRGAERLRKHRAARAGRVGGTPLEVLQKPHAGCRSGRSYTNTRLRELRAGSWGAAGARCPLLPSPCGHPGAPNRARGLSPSNPFSFQPGLFPTSMRDAGCAAHGLGCVFGGFPAEFCKGKQAGGIRGSPQPDGEAPRSSWCACAIVPPPPFFFFIYIKDKKTNGKLN